MEVLYEFIKENVMYYDVYSLCCDNASYGNGRRRNRG